jgi:hypothetical protein
MPVMDGMSINSTINLNYNHLVGLKHSVVLAQHSDKI